MCWWDVTLEFTQSLFGFVDVFLVSAGSSFRIYFTDAQADLGVFM